MTTTASIRRNLGYPLGPHRYRTRPRPYQWRAYLVQRVAQLGLEKEEGIIEEKTIIRSYEIMTRQQQTFFCFEFYELVFPLLKLIRLRVS